MDKSIKNEFVRSIRQCAVDVARFGPSALGPLYDLTAPRLVRYAQMITRNREDAEDAMQAAMVRIALKPKALSTAGHPWPYFVRVVRNEALKILRKRRPSRSISVVGDPQCDQANNAEEEDSRRFVREAIDRLPAKQAEVVLLKVWEGMTFAEIANVLEESPNTVASRYRYALEKLTDLLDPVRV